jgi:hypothetical protein
MLNKTLRLFNTVKFLKPIQIKYRLYYFARKKIRATLKITPSFSKDSTTQLLNLRESIHIADCYMGQNKFTFLNLEKQFGNEMNWNYSNHGKLWTYNLTYFDYLSQLNNEDNLYLIHSFIDDIEKIKDGLEAFPISLRGINWIKHLSYHQIQDKKIDNSLYAQYYILVDNLEYHLFGNHLLENSFSLLFGAYYFKDDFLYKKAKELLLKELEEQILEDGGHFELSPMYHQIMLFRLLDCINLVQNNSWKDSDLLDFLIKKSELMLGWLENISYKNGEIPLFNDSSNGIAPTNNQLFSYANRLKLEIKKTSLSQSGYRKISKENYECIVDVGHIGAEYIPGHAHADAFNFELQIKGKPFIVDTGLSTYETNDRRTLERSTASHNTVEVNGKSQSEVWGGFRVANRANIIALKEDENSIESTHDGYKNDNVYHTRKWTFEEDKVVIEDRLSKEADGIARFHFSPNISEEEILTYLELDESKIKFEKYSYSPKFNIKLESLVLNIYFNNYLKIKINIPSTM